MERRGQKRVRGLSGRMAVDDDQRKNAKQIRLEALESGVDEDAFQIDDNDEEFNVEEELEGGEEGHGRGRKKKLGGSTKIGNSSSGAGSSFMVLLEESGVYEDKVPAPHYLTAEAEPSIEPGRLFCCVCGNVSPYKCSRCMEPFCSRRCNKTHNEAQCVKMTL